MVESNNESAKAEEPPRKLSKKEGSTASLSKPSIQKDMVELLLGQEAEAKKAETKREVRLAKIGVTIEVVESTIGKDAVS